MRLVKRPEFMQLPAGTLFAPMQQKWVFGTLSVKGDTSQHGDEIGDFLKLGLTWIEGDGFSEVTDRLEEMLADSTVSYPLQSGYGREGLFDNDMVYLIYEPADVAELLAAINQTQQSDEC